jgi:parallel beta-helix repeat protein
MKRRTRLSITLFCLFVIVPAFWASASLGANTLHVPAEYPTIQLAIINAAADADTVVTVLVDDGTYSGPLSIVGRAINIKSKNGPDNCAIVIGENQTGTVITFSGIETSGSVLSGFTISGGNGVDFGGGILCDNGASPTIENCVITGNQAKSGGGIASLNSSPIIQDCDIEANTSLSGGGGLYIYTDPSFSPSTPTITEGAIFDNVGGYFGGGLFIYNSSPFISSCLIAGNKASLRGAGIYCFTTSSPIITNCTVADNTLTGSNSLGGGIHVFNKCHPEIKNSILWNDSATYGSEIYLNANSSLHVSSSDVMGGNDAAYVYDKGTSTVLWDDTNINEDPLFVGQDDYHLSPKSPCIDAGIDTGDLPEFDFEGEDPRIINGKPDIGADETTETDLIVDIDIKPGSGHKEIDLRDKGVVPVAVLSSKDFDARMIDPKSVHFAGAAPVRFVLNNVNRNYHLDMLFFFKTQQLDLDENSSEATLTGKTVEGVSFKGTDSVTIYKPKCKAKTLWKSAKIKHRFRHKHVHRHCSK